MATLRDELLAKRQQQSQGQDQRPLREQILERRRLRAAPSAPAPSAPSVPAPTPAPTVPIVPVTPGPAPVPTPQTQPPSVEVEEIPRPPRGDEFSVIESLERGGRNFAGNVAAAFGNQEFAEEVMQRAPAAFTPSFRDVEGLGTGASFIGERTLESLPGTGVSLASAGLGFAIGGPIGGMIGFALGSGIPLLGEARREIIEEGGEGTALEALAPAAANTALEAIPISKVARMLGVGKVFQKSVNEVVEEAVEEVGIISEALGKAAETGSLAIQESVVETLQELNNMLAGKFFSDKEVLELNDRDQDRLLEAFFGGLGGGAGMGISAQVAGTGIQKVQEFRAKRAAEKETEKVRKAATRIVQDEITEKKKVLEQTEGVLQTAAGRFSRGTPFKVFAPFSGKHQGEIGPLPPGKTGYGPGFSIFGHHITMDMTAVNERLGNLLVDVGRVPVKFSQVDRNSGTQVFRVRENRNKIAKFGEGKQSLSRTEAFEHIRDLVEKVLKDMGLENIQILLGDSVTINSALEGKVTRPSDLGQISRREDGMNFIGLNFSALTDQSLTRTHALAQLTSTAMHELGHAIINERWGKLDTVTKDGLLQGYRDWLSDQETLDADEWFKKYDTPVRSGRITKKETMKEWLAKRTPKVRGYYTSFDEYAAQMTSRALTRKFGDLKLSESEKSFWADVAKLLKDLWNNVKDQLPGNETFDAFLEGMFLRKELRDLEEVESQLVVPESERKSTIQRIKEGIGLERPDQDVLSESDYEPLTVSQMADLLESVGMEREAQDLRQHQDVQLGFMNLANVLSPLQLSRLSDRRGIRTPGEYINLVREFQNTKMGQVVRADEIAREWRALGKTDMTKLGNFLYAVSTESDEKGRRLSPEELSLLRGRHDINDELFAMWQQIDQSFVEVLNNIERGLVFDAAKSVIPDTQRAKEFRDRYLAARNDQERMNLIIEFSGQELIPADSDNIFNQLFVQLGEINKSIKELREKNYFPRTRLGQYTIKLVSTAAGQEWEGKTSTKAEETLGYYTYETRRERNENWKLMKQEANAAGLSSSRSMIDTEVFSVMGMPEVLIQRVMNDDRIKLNTEQQEELQNISLNLSPGKRFLRHLKRRRGIAGFSTDALRVYSTYMQSAANHLARVEHSKEMIEKLQEFENQIRDLERTNLGGDIGDLVRMKQYFNEHFNYLMKPDNDWAQLRSVGFLWYLGFGVKSAFVNLTQIPMVTYPVLAGTYGDAKAFKEISKAYADMPKFIRNGQPLADGEMAMLQQLHDEGILDESMVMELAGMGEQDVLKRHIPGWNLDNVVNKMSYYGGAMFRMGEKFNRHVTAIAAYRLAREAGEPDPVRSAREAIETSQFEYARWNRPKFMRGKRSVIFLFWQYMQHASFLFFGGEGGKTARRMWILAAFIAGIEGLPFAKTLMEIIDFTSTEMKELFGSANPRVDMEEMLRDLLLNITDEPDLFMRGMSAYWGLGPIHLLSLLGAPIPNVDISGSLSFGSPVPFLDEAFTGQGNADEEIGKFTAAVLGPVGGMMLQAYRSATSRDPDEWKNIERSLPVFMKNALQGGRWLAEGEETFRGGGQFLDMDNPEGRVSAIMKMLGFQSTRLSQKYKMVTKQQEAALYWTLRKQLLLEDYAFAIKTKDREGKKDAMEAIKKHNKELRKIKSLRGLAISGKDMRRSLRARFRSQALRERGIPQSRREVPLAQEMERLFGVTAN